jgi:hypothetical protein
MKSRPSSEGAHLAEEMNKTQLTSKEFEQTLKIFNLVNMAMRRVAQTLKAAHARAGAGRGRSIKALDGSRDAAMVNSMAQHAALSLPGSRGSLVSYLLYLRLMRPNVEPVDVCDITVLPQVDASSHTVTGVVVAIQPYLIPNEGRPPSGVGEGEWRGTGAGSRQTNSAAAAMSSRRMFA